MALSSRAHAFSVEALVGRPSKRKLQDPREEFQPNFQEKEGGKEERRCCAAGKRSEQSAQKRPKAEPSATAFSGSVEERDAIQVELQGSELWKRFHDIGTEMIITKAGRYVYHSSQWMVAGNTDHRCIAPRLYVHPDSPCSGETWMRQIISFDRVKLTNNEMDDKGHIILQSMHKYKPRVHVMEQDGGGDLSQIQSLPAGGVKTFSFKETEFTTVTAYQNQQITKLKIDRNPFAKGFRDPGRNRGILDGLLETYPWRPSLTLDFKTFGADTQSGSSGSSPVTSSGGAPSPLNPLLSSPCSPPMFHLPSCLGMPCPEAYPHINLPLCYKICPTNFWQQQPLVLPVPERLSSINSSQSLTPLMLEIPILSSLGIHQFKKMVHLKTSVDSLYRHLILPVKMLYGLQAPGSIFQNSIAQKALACPFYPSCGFYRYNFATPSRPYAADHIKMNDQGQVSLRESKWNHAHWHPTINHCL
uniref:T-box transcription factor 22 n=1 Tax=Loxodonta africana TaxID=9785 RepID=G3UBB1_LOXAF